MYVDLERQNGLLVDAMKIEHIAVWTRDAKRLTAFYISFLDGRLSEEHKDPDTGFYSCFIECSEGARLEIMQATNVEDRPDSLVERSVGFTHLAFRGNAAAEIDAIAERFVENGYRMEKEPVTMDDGYYECSVFDPDSNIIEFTHKSN
ncbi:VOC family protein [Puniceicoccaceae bacterium K14]|nr:VOC family protein [Puniceicoccaceae bacterium K14]